MRAWWAWLQVAQHEWWFVPAGLGLLAVTVAAVVLMRIAVSRASSWLLNPRMKGTEAQVEALLAAGARELVVVVSPDGEPLAAGLKVGVMVRSGKRFAAATSRWSPARSIG